MNLQEIIEHHKLKYPLMQETDICKLLYQSVFGGKHLYMEYPETFNYIKKEASMCSNTDYRIEDIGNNRCRFYLYKANDAIYHVITKLFLQSTMDDSATLYYQYLDKLNIAYDPHDALQPFSHSETYRQNYQPHYRVIDKDLADLFPLLACIVNLMEQKKCVFISIEGEAGSGKTTLANTLEKIFGGVTLHMDDFFLQPYQRNDARLEEPGENVDHERFLKDVLQPLQQTGVCKYQRFNCRTMQLEQEITLIKQLPLVIVEGSYSMHPNLQSYYDLSIFIEVDSDIQQQRILARNGSEMVEMFVKKWIPLERAYHQKYHIPKIVDYTIKK